MKFFLIAIVTGIFFGSCSTTKITSRWKAPDLSPQSGYRKILALVVAGNEERPLIQKMESHISGDFKEMGYSAYSAYAEFGPKAFVGLKEAELMNKFNTLGVDAVMMVSLLNKTKERYYIPGRMQRTPYAYYNNRFERHYGVIYERTNSPGYYAEDTRYFWECSFYDTHTGQLLYSAISESFDPGSLEGLAHQYGTMMVYDMVKQKIIVDKVAKENSQN